MTNIIVDGKKYSVEDGITILDACKQIGIYIPTLCYLKEFGATNVDIATLDYLHSNNRNSAQKKVIEYLILCRGSRQ